ncbi:hypothetical protein [Gluconobacter roseus]|uniref:hypothetical protein n=1 Tax=Gluconobacter roseus TaxID=586239 RepID=UPI001E3F2129|nr:hypothetical protein [Gluconobacter roseus]
MTIRLSLLAASALLAATCSGAIAAPAPDTAQLGALLAMPYANGLTGAAKTARLAWVERRDGVRNILISDGGAPPPARSLPIRRMTEPICGASPSARTGEYWPSSKAAMQNIRTTTPPTPAMRPSRAGKPCVSSCPMAGPSLLAKDIVRSSPLTDAYWPSCGVARCWSANRVRRHMSS